MRYSLLFAGASVLLAGGCADRLCNDIGVDYGLILALEHGANAGAYQVQFSAENRMLLVDYSIDGDGQPTCVEGCRDEAEPLSIQPPGGFGFSLLRPPGMSLVLNVRRDTAPKWGPDAFHLAIYRDQVLVHDRDYQVTYDVSEPWGEGCGEDVVATIPVDLTSPP
ncbi:MAG: hypothetical protein HOV81_28340 [Kofleriaceae bacterium]|nr:hypothetical protein [Kofleriaceae bacterium]